MKKHLMYKISAVTIMLFLASCLFIQTTGAIDETPKIILTSTAAISDEQLSGDVNGDSKVNMTDIIILQQVISKIVTPNDTMTVCGDVDENGAINMSDVVITQRYLAKQISSLPYDAEKEALILRSLTINNSSINLMPNDTYKLSYTFSPTTAVVKLNWTSSDNSVATVDNTGRVTAISSGRAFIMAKSDNGVTSTCSVLVKSPATSVILSNDKVTLGLGEPYTLSATVDDEHYANSYTYTSSNRSILYVDKNTGQVYTVATGTAKVTCTADTGATGVCTITVKTAPTGVTLNTDYMEIGVDESYTFLYEIQGGYDNNPKFESSNSAIGKIDEKTGRLVGVSDGVIMIRVITYNEVAAYCTVVIREEPTSVSLSKNSLTYGVGEMYQFSIEFSENTYARYYYYESSNPSVVKVDKWSGKMEAVGAGTAIVSVNVYNGINDSCMINVKNAPSAILISPSVINVHAGQYANVSYALPSDCYADEYRYQSSNTAIATVDAKTGRIETKSSGTCDIIVSVYNGVTATCKLTVAPAISKAEEILESVNAERAKYGVAPLTLNSAATAASQIRARELASSYSHTRPNGTSCFTALSDQGLKCISSAENIGYGYIYTQDVAQAWIDSPDHHKNMINAEYTQMGVGYYEKDGSTFWSEFFVRLK